MHSILHVIAWFSRYIFALSGADATVVVSRTDDWLFSPEGSALLAWFTRPAESTAQVPLL